MSSSVSRTLTAAVIGGTTSAISGGKFGNGALTGAFSQAFNEGVHEWSATNAQARYNAASKLLDARRDTILFPQFGTTDEAAQWFSSLTQDISTKYGVEIGADIFANGNGAYVLNDLVIGSRFSQATGIGNSVPIPGHPNDLSYVAYAHTHPIYVSNTDYGQFSTNDLSLAIDRRIDAYVSYPGGYSHFSYPAWSSGSGYTGSISIAKGFGW